MGTHLEPEIVWSPLTASWQVYDAVCFKQSHRAIHGTVARVQLVVHNILLLGAPTMKCCSQMDFSGLDLAFVVRGTPKAITN